jgi:hypothetical protein
MPCFLKSTSCIYMTAASKICDAAKLFLHVLLAANVSTEVDTVLEEREEGGGQEHRAFPIRDFWRTYP